LNDCTRWAAIEDKLAVDDAEGVDLPFWRAHPETCEACRAERDVLAGLHALSPAAPPAVTEVDRAIVERVVSAHRRERTRTTSLRLGGGALVVATIAAGLVLWLRPRADAAPEAASTVASPSVTPAEALVTTIAWAGSARRPDGTVMRVGDRVAVGDELHAGTEGACVRSSEDAFVCLAAGSTLRIAEASSTRRTFEVVAGRVVASLAHQTEGASFVLAGGGIQARAVGTVFSLEVGRGPAPIVCVLDGIVGVSRGPATASDEIRLERHQHLASPGAVEAATREEEEVDAALLDHVEALRRFALLPELSPDHAADAGTNHPRATPLGSSGTKAAAPAARSPGEYLAEAREARRAGRAGDAAKAYESLLRAYPDRDEAQAARLSLADLRLGSGDPSSALRMFDDYIAKGGPLEQEAREGRIRALRALGRTAQERAAIADFVARFPKSVHATRLEARARELSP